ncbi:MAG: methylenetetrahydrofolate dehydrogenase (NADP+) / methenyltetrahydrofolate cyclohydrolase [Parcubacteria group bacterium Gr01-1014_33]|nr:MAG: methylenetetrahydrofolate dehydrogenase (NADP+) / methenyltetrahydrofolate cyclohydrolase [Parcubacteria group bacterium Gr01-1014_33]
MIILDGKALSQKILSGLAEEIKKFPRKLRLAVVVVGEDPVVRKFIEQKKKTGESIGIDVRVYPFKEAITTNELRKRIAEIVHEKKNTGVIIQLPLPPQINKQYILNSVVPEKDVDMLSGRALGSFIVGKHPTGRASGFSPIMPPVAGAVKALFEEYAIPYTEKNIVILGAGNLVGRPIALWMLQQGATVSVITENSPNPQSLILQADIIISGIGKPHSVTGDMVKEGAVVIDAGTSESEGKLVGDIDFDSVSQKASHITPVPGGVGPLTVAMLFKNLLTLAKI